MKVVRRHRRTIGRAGLLIALALLGCWILSAGVCFVCESARGNRIAIEFGTVAIVWGETNSGGDPRCVVVRTPIGLVLWPDGSFEANWLVVPLWIPMILCAGVAWLALRARFRVGVCRKCGYDLAGLQDATVCPECGVQGPDESPNRPPAVALLNVMKRRWRWITLGACLVLSGVAVTGILNWEHRPVRDVAQYAELRQRMSEIVGPQAIAHMPPAVSTAAKSPRVWAWIGGKNESSELLLRVQMNPEDLVAALTSVRARALVDRPGHFAEWHCQRGLEDLLPGSDYGSALPRSFEIISLHNEDVSIGVDNISAGVLVDESTGTVIWWVRRWRVPFN